MKNESYIMYIKNGEIKKFILEGRLKKIKHGFVDYYLKEFNKSCQDFMIVDMKNIHCLECKIHPEIDYIEFNNISFELEKNSASMAKFILNKNSDIVFRNCSLGYVYVDNNCSLELKNCKFTHVIADKLKNVKIINHQKFNDSIVKELPLLNKKLYLEKVKNDLSNVTINAENFYMDTPLLSFGKIQVDTKESITLENINKNKNLFLKSKLIKIDNTNINPSLMQIMTNKLSLKDSNIKASTLFMDPIFIQMDEKSNLVSPKWKRNNISLLVPSEKCDFSLKNEDSLEYQKQNYRRKMISILKGIEDYYRNQILEEEKNIQNEYTKLIDDKKKEVYDLTTEFNEKRTSIMKKIEKKKIKNL